MIEYILDTFVGLFNGVLDAVVGFTNSGFGAVSELSSNIFG